MPTPKKTTGRTTAKKVPPQITPVDEWIESAQESQGVPLELPSGKIALVKPLGIQHFMRAGRIPNTLSPFVESMISGASGKPVDAEKEAADFAQGLAKNPDQFKDLFDFVDAITVECVEQPPVLPIPMNALEEPVPIGERPRGLYVDMVDLDDKMFIFNFAVGGTRDVQRFHREVAASSVGPVRPSKRVGSTAKRSARAR